MIAYHSTIHDWTAVCGEEATLVILCLGMGAVAPLAQNHPTVVWPAVGAPLAIIVGVVFAVEAAVTAMRRARYATHAGSDLHAQCDQLPPRLSYQGPESELRRLLEAGSSKANNLPVEATSLLVFRPWWRPVLWVALMAPLWCFILGQRWLTGYVSTGVIAVAIGAVVSQLFWPVTFSIKGGTISRRSRSVFALGKIELRQAELACSPVFCDLAEGLLVVQDARGRTIKVPLRHVTKPWTFIKVAMRVVLDRAGAEDNV